MSEAELAIEEKLRKKRQEEQQAWQEYLQFREKERAREEDELKKLKERQVSSLNFFWLAHYSIRPSTDLALIFAFEF